MKLSIKEVIRLLGEIESLMASDIFYNLEWDEYTDEELKEEGISSQLELYTALEEARVHLNDIAPYEKETLLYKISLSDEESTQGFQLYDVSYKGEIIGTCSVKPLLKESVDIYEIEKNGFTFIESCNLTNLFKGGK
tara:strand:+ start:114 stop:524 length:411 start_codon:yes stop_codon:yes gene_type:complete